VNVAEISVGSRILPPDPDNIASLIESYQHTKQITPLRVRAIYEPGKLPSSFVLVYGMNRL
jgi:hypothetical protein